MQYHEENSPIQIYSSEKAALETLNCNHQEAIRPPSLLTVDEDENEEQSHSDVIEVKDFIRNEERRKREEEMQGDQYRDNFISDQRTTTQPPRGDIPSNAIESCDGKLLVTTT